MREQDGRTSLPLPEKGRRLDYQTWTDFFLAWGDPDERAIPVRATSLDRERKRSWFITIACPFDSTLVEICIANAEHRDVHLWSKKAMRPWTESLFKEFVETGDLK